MGQRAVNVPFHLLITHTPTHMNRASYLNAQACPSVDSSIIYNCQTMETTKMSNDR